MRSNKRFTNQTFTKRVDHEGGLHRPLARLPEPSVCRDCGAVYMGRRWAPKEVYNTPQDRELLRTAEIRECPACKQIRSGIVGGYVTIGGTFIDRHREEIENLLTNEAERAGSDNPLSKIMTRRQTPAGLVVETTTEHLAQRIGHALKKAFHGEVSYQFSHENKVVRVSWVRN